MADKKTIALSTAAVPPDTFTVDDEPYELYGMAHLNVNDEAEVLAAIAQYQRLNDRLAAVASRTKGKVFATKMAELRIELLVRMTSLTPEIAQQLPISHQLTLFSAIVDSLNAEDASDYEIEDEDLSEGGVAGTEPKKPQAAPAVTDGDDVDPA